MMIGYARAEEGPDEDEQRSSCAVLGVEFDHIHSDRKLCGTRNDLPARAAMLADLTAGDIVAVTGLERLARSATELGEVADAIEQRGASLRVGPTVYDPATETGRTAFAMLPQTFPDFQAEIYQLRWMNSGNPVLLHDLKSVNIEVCRIKARSAAHRSGRSRSRRTARVIWPACSRRSAIRCGCGC